MADCLNRHTETAAIVTGGAQGVGYAIARQLAQEGCKHLYLAGRDAAQGPAEFGGASVVGSLKDGTNVVVVVGDRDQPVGGVAAGVGQRLRAAGAAGAGGDVEPRRLAVEHQPVGRHDADDLLGVEDGLQ